MRSELGWCCWFSKYSNTLLGAVAVGMFLWLVVVGSAESGRRDQHESVAKTSSIGSAEEAGGSELLGGSQFVKQPNNSHPEWLDLISKVKVPKGPDPIHNRRIGVKGGPPGRA